MKFHRGQEVWYVGRHNELNKAEFISYSTCLRENDCAEIRIFRSNLNKDVGFGQKYEYNTSIVRTGHLCTSLKKAIKLAEKIDRESPKIENLDDPNVSRYVGNY